MTVWYNDRMKCFTLLAAFVCAVSVSAVDFAAFRDPPRSSRPETWFHLIGGNVAKLGMVADLDAVADAGISGIQLFHGQFGGPWPGVSPQIPCLSRDWDDLISFIADGCEARGLTFKMQNCPGWSMSGGPWIAPSNAMRNLSYSRTDVDGGRPVRIALPIPHSPAPEIRISETDRDYQDLFVLAFPTPDGDVPGYLEPESVQTESREGRLTLTYRFSQPVSIRTFEMPSPSDMNHARSYAPLIRAELCAVYDDGRTETVAGGKMPQGCWQDFVPVTFSGLGSGKDYRDTPPSKTWRVTIDHEHEINKPKIRLIGGVRLDNWEGKAGWVLRGMECVRDGDRNASRFFVKGDAVLDITERLRGGTLDWTPPPGKWTVLRIGHVNNGARNAPAPREATGWECNKMDVRGIDAHLAAYIGRLASGPLAGGKLKGFVVDSWECHRQTWTANLENDFREARGYGFRKLLPAVFGWVVDSPEATESFLRDWRRTLGELVERNYYARMSEFARKNGMTAQYETAFGDVLPGDLMAFWKHCETPMCEFWFPRTTVGVGSDDFKPIIPCASAAHIYGKRRVAAESFTTTTLKWDEDPKRLKACANHAFSRGVTHLVFHTYTHNPRTDWKLPGTSFGHKIGTPFIRGQSWWRFMPEFTEWVARCGEMLEAGKPANEILWFVGEDVGHKPSEKSPFPAGYKYDYVNRDALIGRITVKDGLFCTPEGVTWKVLWAPSGGYVSKEVAERLRSFVAAGGKVVTGSVADADGRRTVSWNDVVRSVPSMKLPDVSCGPDAKGRTIVDWRKGEQPIEWIHRRGDAHDWYFVAANGMDAYNGEVTFRMEGEVSIWDPVTGERYSPHAVRRGGGCTTLPINLAGGECIFVVFSHGGKKLPGSIAAKRSSEECRDVRGIDAWTLSFPRGWGAPESLALRKLISWTELPIGDEGRSFSGTATYTASFKGKKGETLELDLGEVETAAEVFVNGKPVRKLWSPPYRCCIGEFVVDGENSLRVEVTSTWYNRLAYDAGLPETERKTWTIAAPPKGAKPKAAGLLGPVALRRW